MNWVNWKQEPWTVIFRFNTMILATVLVVMSYSSSLPPNIARLCHLFGFCGWAFYFCLELVADQRAQRRAVASRKNAERRL